MLKHLLYATPKLVQSLNERGISEFDSALTKGVIRHGSTREPQRLDIRIWSQVGLISQEIVVDIADDQLRGSVTNSIVATLKYAVTSVPTRDSLLKMAADNVESINSASDASQ